MLANRAHLKSVAETVMRRACVKLLIFPHWETGRGLDSSEDRIHIRILALSI